MSNRACTMGMTCREDASQLTERHSHDVVTPRLFFVILACILGLGLILRLLLLGEYLVRDPFAVRPISDAFSYWEWAGRLAAGRGAAREPFFSGPLYPYVLAPLRAAGGGLPTIYLLQIAADLVTAAMLAWIGRKRFGATAGLLAAALYLLMLEPASMALRVLPCTLEALLVASAWLAMLDLPGRPTAARGMLASGLLGLLALAFPPALLCLPIFAVWYWSISPKGMAAIRQTAIAMLGAGAVILPATIHNYRACGELIPVSAQAGVTFAQGNTPQSIGVYSPLAGISGQHGAQNRDAMRVYTRATGGSPNWNAANRYFFGRGLAVWRADPALAVSLFVRKAYWFLAGRHQSEIYWPTMELAEGLLPRLAIFPIQTPWLIPLAFVALLILARRPITFMPELMLFLVPCVVVTLFFYSPRYRFPAVPVIAVTAAWSLCLGCAAGKAFYRGDASAPPTTRCWLVMTAAAILVSIAMEPINALIGFDRWKNDRGSFWCMVGDVARLADRKSEAADAYRKGLSIGPPGAMAAANLSRVLLQTGRPADAERALRMAIDLRPQDARKNVDLPDEAMLHHDLGAALAAQNRPADAIAEFEAALRLSPEPAIAASVVRRMAITKAAIPAESPSPENNRH